MLTQPCCASSRRASASKPAMTPRSSKFHSWRFDRMLRLDRIIKPWKESGALNSQINLYGFWNEHTFITKSGDLGIVLRLRGVDYESLDQPAQEYAVKRLESALKTFGPGFHVYQYLFKTSRPTVPFQEYADPVVQAAVDQRKQFFAEKLDELFTVEIFF